MATMLEAYIIGSDTALTGIRIHSYGLRRKAQGMGVSGARNVTFVILYGRDRDHTTTLLVSAWELA